MSVPNIFSKFFGSIDVSKLDENFDYLFNTQVSIPTGLIAFFPMDSVPTGWLKCNGASLNTITYAALFAKIGYTYGGSANSFLLPDLRGEFIRCYDDGRGVDSGRVLGSFQDASAITNIVFQGAYLQSSLNLDRTEFFQNTVSNNGAGTAGYTRDGSYWFFRPRNIALLPCIKY